MAKQKYKPEFIKQVEKLCALCYNKIADFFGVSVATLYRWKMIPRVLRSLKVSKEIADDRVGVRSLFASDKRVWT